MSDDKNNTEKEKNELNVFDDEKHILLDHDYDGIKELDHPLPSWWLAIFYVSIVFCVPYYIYYTFFKPESINDNYKTEVARVLKMQADYEAKEGAFDIEAYRKMIVSKKSKKLARKTYKRKCKACHGKFGEGLVGPNLADKYWMHGDGSLESIYKTIKNGIEEKGMPAWGQKLSKEAMYAVLSHVEKLQGTNPENAKEPQGKLIE